MEQEEKKRKTLDNLFNNILFKNLIENIYKALELYKKLKQNQNYSKKYKIKKTNSIFMMT